MAISLDCDLRRRQLYFSSLEFGCSRLHMLSLVVSEALLSEASAQLSLFGLRLLSQKFPEVPHDFVLPIVSFKRMKSILGLAW